MVSALKDHIEKSSEKGELDIVQEGEDFKGQGQERYSRKRK